MPREWFIGLTNIYRKYPRRLRILRTRGIRMAACVIATRMRTEHLPEEDAECTVAFLRAAVAYYAGLNVRIKGVYTDNAMVYRGRDFAQACAQLGPTHHCTKPYTPRTDAGSDPRLSRSARPWHEVREWTSC